MSSTAVAGEQPEDAAARPDAADVTPGELSQALRLPPAHVAAGRQGHLQSPEGRQGEAVVAHPASAPAHRLHRARACQACSAAAAVAVV